MKTSPQDRRYLEAEADAFFSRNFAGRADPKTLRPNKRAIADAVAACRHTPRRVLEYGCGYGDLLQHYAAEHGAECHGVEPSARSIAFGRDAYGDRIRLCQGTIADNPVNADPTRSGSFDLVIAEDVLCWVSRQTLFQSIANIDDALCDGGLLFLREFYPLANRRNANHHVADGTVHCYKPAGPHLRMFTASGVYEVIWQKVWMDLADPWVAGAQSERSPFESRWSDAVLRKSWADYYR